MEDSDDDSFRSIKCSLNTFCKDEDVKERINEFVLNANKLIFEAYSFANLHVIRLVRANKDIPPLDQKFFQSCCVFVSETYERKSQKPKDNDMLETYKVYKSCRPSTYKPPFRDYCGEVINYIKKDMVIATTNHLVLNFYKRFTKYLRHRYGYDGCKIYNLVKNIYVEEYDGDDDEILFWRRRLGDKPPYAKYIKRDPTYILKIYDEISSYIDINNADREFTKKPLRTFSLLPHKNSFNMSYITIDKGVLRDLINSFKKKHVENEKISTCNAMHNTLFKNDIKDNPITYWNMFYKIKKIDDFAGIIKTDGKSVSIMYNTQRLSKITKKKKSVTNLHINPSEYDVIRAFDPGYRYMFVGTDTCDTNSDALIKCSSREYYEKCKMIEATKKIRVIYDGDPEITDIVTNMPTNKTNDVSCYLLYIKHSLLNLDQLLHFHYDKPFRRMRITTHIYQQKTMHELCKRITNKKHPHDKNIKALIGIGNWSSQHDSIIRGHCRGPIVALKRELKKWCKLVEVDEFRTSVTCYKCHSNTIKMSYNSVQVNSVLRCSNNECGTVLDRDVNGCKNILHIFDAMLNRLPRPEAFCRTTNKN